MNAATERETIDQMVERFEIERPGFKAEFDCIMADTAQKKIDDDRTAQLWRDRKRVKFADLSFVGKKYRSRNRRSANKMSAWAIKTPTNLRDAAAQGVSMGMEFCQWIVDSPHAGSGYGLFEVVKGMAERLASLEGGYDQFGEEVRIRGLCSVLETYAQLFAGYPNMPDLARAHHQAASLAYRESWQDNQRHNVFCKKPDLFEEVCNVE